MREFVFFAVGVLAGAGLAFRVAEVCLAEIRHLHRVVLEMKRRMSVARVQADRVSFDAGGDPERYGESVADFAGDGQVMPFLWSGRSYDAREPEPKT